MQDVCIVGAGPAGIATALFLAKQKISSYLVDKNTFPRPKPCADNITGNTIRILRELDPTFFKNIPIEEKILPIQGVKAHAPNGKKIILDFLPLEKDTELPSCYAIRREDLDYQLFQKAKENPYIQVCENFWVNDIKKDEQGVYIRSKDGQKIASQLLVLASGSNDGLLPKLTGFETPAKHRAVGLRGYFEGVKGISLQYCELYISPQLLPGGLYITPFADGKVNVNVVMRSDVVQKKKINLPQALQQTLESHPILKEKFANARPIGKFEGSSLLLGTHKRKLSGNRYVLVGDSAGLIDLLSANGLPQAMISAKLAAQQIAICMTSRDFSAASLEAYDQALFKRVDSYLKLSRMMAPFLKNRFFLWAIVMFMNFLAHKFERNEALRNLIYDPKIERTLQKPAFYYRLFFGLKNAESLHKTS